MTYTLPLISASGTGEREIELPGEIKPHLLFEVVRWQLASRRRGTAATKNRDKMQYSTRKLYPQKGTGRARHGSRGAGIYVGGATTFGPQPRDYSYTLPKKVRKQGLSMALADRAKGGKLMLVEVFGGVDGTTKSFLAWAKSHGFDGSERILLTSADAQVRRAARNLPWVSTLEPAGLNVYDILRCEWLVVDADRLGDGV